MANNKIQLSDGTVLIDLTSDTATAADVAQGKTFHLADGTAATGTASGGGGGGVDINTLNDETISGHVVVTGTSLRALLFSGCDLITSVSCPNATNGYSVRQSGTNRAGSQFEDCTALQSAELPAMTNPPDAMFRGCTALTHVSMPSAKTVSTLLFADCTSLETIVMPSVNGLLYTSAFRTCTGLKSVDLYKPNFGRTLIFDGCSSLNTLIVRNTSVSALGNLNVFNGTPFASGGTGGTLYVPSALISSYQSATNWSTILGYANNQILPIEGSIYETQYADGTPIT